MSLRSIESLSRSKASVLVVVCLAMTALISGCATMGGGSANPFVGTWDIVVDSPLGTSEQTLVIASDMTGAIETAEIGTLEISNVASEGNAASFDVVFDIQGQQLPAKFVGTIDGDSLSGEYITDLGNATVTGTRR
ncbi:MAG: hypothetical protein QGD90_07365 [Candidatus Hydrogenedentes bacterium]|nr:hypothetical protein [Candidatus Hydrogenedentota bacterium]